MNMREEVILVDETDKEKGVMEKIEAHEKALLHRAFSVFIFNSKGEMLLQQRALTKYHSAGLWTNTCCSHPRPGETVTEAAHRRLMEEMGLKVDLKHLTWFIYKAAFGNGLTEHELDHVFTGVCESNPAINKNEVNAFKWVEPGKLRQDMELNPSLYTEWFKIAMRKIFTHPE